MGRCSCLPTYSPGGGSPPSSPVCPPECLQAGTVIVPSNEGLGCTDDYVIDLTTITVAGDCENISFSVYDDGGLDAGIVGTTLTITNDSTDGDLEGTYVTVTYLMSCDDDIRQVTGEIQIYITDVCVI